MSKPDDIMSDEEFNSFLDNSASEKATPIDIMSDEEFNSFLGSENEPSAPSPDVQAGLGQPTAEPTPKKRGITMSPEEMNVPQSTILSKEDAAAKGGMTANEVAARSYEQATGADAPGNAILAHLANMGNNLGGRLNANLQMQAAQKMASGDFDDAATENLMDQMVYGGVKRFNEVVSSVPSVAGPGMMMTMQAHRRMEHIPNEVLKEWDETLGKGYKTDAERKAAKREFVQELARQFIAERTATKQNATTELENRERGFAANVFGKGPEQVGNMLPYMLGPVGITFHFAEEAGAAGTGYANDEYGFAKDGSLGVTAEGDSAGKAAAKGIASSGIETATEVVGGKLASAGMKRVGKTVGKWIEPVLAKGGKALVGKYPVLSEVGGKIVQSDIGKSVAKFGGKMKDAFRLVSKKMHWDGLPEETAEELESDVLSSLLGVGKRDSEYRNAETGEPLGAGGRLWDATKDFFTPKNFIELQEAMLLTMGAGGFIAHMSQRGAQKQVDSFMESKGIMDAEEVKKADLQTKVAAMDAYVNGLSEEQVREKLDTASGLLDGMNKWLDKGFAKIAGEETDTDKVVRLKDFLSETDSYNSLVERAAEVSDAARKLGGTPKRFTVQTDENGKPKFQQTVVVSPATGENVTRNQMSDADSGVTVIDTAGHYEVKSDVTGETFRTQSFDRAINAADSMAVLNQLRVAERQQKAQGLSQMLGDKKFKGRKFEVVETAQQARDKFGGDIEDDTPGFTTADGTTVLILDNLDNPKTAIAALDVGTPNDRGAFADGVEFANEAEADEYGDVTETKIARDKVHGVNIIDAGDGTFVVYNDNGGYATASSLEEAVAVANGAKPKPIQPKAETTAQEQPNETRANEAPAQPKQGEATEPPAGTEARPMESAEAPAEAADAGVVEPETPAKPAEAAQKPAEAAAKPKASKDTPTTAKPVETPSRASDAKPDEKGGVASPETPDTSDLEKMIADADPDLESVKASGDAKAFKDALANKNLPLDEANRLLDRFYETHPRAAASARVDAKNILKAKNRGKVSAETTTFAQHLIDKYAPDGQTYKAKREASDAATAEKAKAVPVPGFIADKKSGVTESAVKQIEDYLADKSHNGPSLTSAIDGVEAWAKKNGKNLALLNAFRKRINAAVEAAKNRRAKMKDADQQAFGQRNADLPKDLLEKYVGDNRADSLLARLLEYGAFFGRPRSAAAAKSAIGFTNPGIDAKYDGKLFDPDAEGADALNSFFDGMSGAERERWLRILFGRDTKSVSEPVVTGNDVVLEDMGLEMGEALDAIRAEVAAFQKWRESGAESEEDRHYRELYEEEQAALDDEFGPIDQFRIDELEAREAADAEYAAAKAFVENMATAKDIAVYSPSALSAAEDGDAIRIDHQKKTYEFSGYDAENGILYVNDFVEVEVDDAAGVVREPRRFRVTEGGFAEIKEENNGNRRTDETRPADNGASDEKGAGAGGGREGGEGKGGLRQAGSVVRAAEGAARVERTDTRASQYETLHNALDPKWRAEHPDETAKLESEPIHASAVMSNPAVSGTDAISWPVTATKINDREDAANIFRLLSDPGKESTKVLYLDKYGNITGQRVVAVGLVGETDLNIAAVLTDIPKNTYGIVVSHNHPAQQGDNVKASADDVAVTRYLKKAIKAHNVLYDADIRLLDHIITDHNAYESLGLRDASLVSDGAAEFWNNAEVRFAFEGPAVEKPADKMNLVPFDKRINMTEDARGKLDALAALASKARDKSSWIVGIDDAGRVVWVESAPTNADAAAFNEWLDAHPGANRYAVLNGENAVDMPSFVNAIESTWDRSDERSRPLVVAVGENGKLADFAGRGLNDKILNAAKPAAPVKPAAPRLANAPKLNDAASKAIDDILGEMGDLLHSTIEPIYTGSAADYANRSRQGGVDDGPSLLKIGTGEGSQVYGWGLYGSTVRGVAEGYAETDLSRKDRELRNKSMADPKWGRTKKVVFNGERPEVNSPLEKGLSYLQLMEMTIDDMIDEFRRRNKAVRRRRSLSAQNKAKYIADNESMIRALDENRHLIEAPFAPRPHKHIYEQTFFTNRAAGDESHLLKWYEPVSEEQMKWIRSHFNENQEELISDWMRNYYKGREGSGPFALDRSAAEQKARREWEEALAFNNGSDEVATGKDVYTNLSEILGPQAASEFLARAGIDGVKYPVDSYGGKGVKDGDEAGWDYVSFRDDNIRVDHKWRDGEQLYSPVEPLSLSREEERKFRDAVERMVETLADNGYTKFDDLARVVASRRPDVYARAKDLLRRSWNFVARDPADEITIARGNEIFGIIDNELNRETTNDLGTDAVDAGQRDGAQDNGGERDRADRGLSVPAGTGDGGAGQGTRRSGGGERPAAPVRAGAGGLPVDVREDDGHRGGDGGDAVGQRAVGLERRDGGHGEVQRDSEGAVPRVGEEVSPGFTAYEPPSDLPVAAPKSKSLIVEPSALASIPQPPITSKPDIPDSLPQDGVLQAHQYEAVCRAVDSQNKTLPDGRRQGYFVGDGTGAGKTRIIAGVMLDAVNRNLGKGKALIISKNKDLYDGALGDFEPFGISNRLFDLTDPKWKTKLEKNSKGIAFMTYPSLAQNYAGTDGEGNVRSAGKRGKTLNRYEEIVKWLGKDFDGVIALDEAHSAAKDDGATAQQAKRSQAVIDLQNALPNARVLYLTATAAYDAKDLRFLTRMGLWGEGTGFSTFSNFADAVNRGGLSMMEILTQGMKAAGKYCSRAISFKGVNCKRIVANVTPEQKQTYADYSSVLLRIHDVAMSLEGVTGVPRKYLSSQYFGRALDLFNSLITSMKVGKAIELGRQAIAEGKSPVFQLISTNDSAKDAKKSAVPTRKEYDMFGNVIREVPVEDAGEVDANVKDRIVNYLRGGGFPVREYLGMQGGHMQWGEVNPQAVALRYEMIALVNTLPDVGNPIDEIVKAFKDVGISRITGKSNKNTEAAAFNNGDNLALVFSGAGGTGASYHADKRFKNRRQRVQIPIEFGWEPDKFLQALGRSHRNNQVVPPEFVLLTTDIAGEMRFMSTIANRVASMGAIVGGDRNSSGQVVSSSDSVQNKYGSDAINDVKRKLGAGQRIGEMYADEVLDAMFINPDKLDDIKPSQFLGRLQFLPVDEQSAIYGEIASQMERAIAKAKADGTFDDGIRKIDAKRVVVQSRESMSTGENEGQNRDLLTVSEWYDSPRIDHAAVEARVPEGQRIEYVRNRRSGKLYALISRSDGAFARLAPNGSYETVQPLERGNYETVIDKDAARKAWDDEYAALPAEVEYVRHYMSGDLIPVWDKIGVEGLIRVYRATPTGGKPFVGLQISEAQLPVTLYSFGKKDEARRFFKENGYRLAAREGANIGIGAKDDIGRQPYFKRAKIGTRYVLAVFQSGANPALEQSLIDGGWNGTWGRDDANSNDHGGQVYYRDFGEDAEAAFNAVIDQYGSVAYRGRNVGFESKDGLARQAAEETPQRQGVSERPASAGTLGGQSPGRYRPDLVQTGAVRGSLRERVGMPQMRMRVQNGELIITNTRPVRALLNDLKLAFGGEWANRVRDGKRYVKSGLRWNPDPSGRGGWWSIPLDKVPADIRGEIDGEGLLRAPVAPLGSVAEMEREGGLARLSQNPDEFKATFVYNILRSPVAELDGGKYAKEHESNLIRRAADDGDMSALGELYNRYMKPNADKGGLRGLVRRVAARKGMAGVMNESRIEEVASLVWAGTPVDGGYENNRRGIIADFNSGDTAIYKNAKSLIPVMTAKIERILNDMAERATNRPEMLTLDAPSRSREDESELDQQIADDSGVAEGLLGGDAANEYVEEADDTVEDVIARKLGDIEGAAGRRLSRAERKRIEAMDMLDETMYFLPEDLQDVINAVLTEERKGGWTDPNDAQIKASFANAQKKSGLSPRVFGYRYRTAKDLLNEIWRNIRNGKNDANIAIKASSIDGAQESEEELNDEILRRIDEREPESDMTLAIRLLLRGESVADVADFFEISPAMVRAWKSRARNEHGITFPDEEVNPLGLGDFPERKAVKRGGSAPRAARPRSTAWMPDLFAAANATVNDQQNFKIEEGIAAGAPDEQVARDAGVDPVLVHLAKIRNAKPSQAKPVQDTLFSPVAPLEQSTLGIKTPDVADEIFGYTNAAENSWRSEHGYSEIPKGATVSLDAMHRRGAAMANNIDEMRRMVERLEKSPYAVNETDQIALGVFTATMKGEYNRLSRLKAEQYANGNEAMAIQTDIEMDELFKWIDRAQRVNKDVGATWGRTGRARQLALDKAGNIADYMISCERRKGSPLTKEERHQAERLFAELEAKDVELNEATIQDIIQHIDAISKARLSAQHDEVKERKAKKQVEQIERDYHEALAQIRFHGEKRSGGVLHGLPNGQKWIRALEAYHLLNGEGLTDGKPDGAKMVDLLVKDINGVGVEAAAWDVRQLESRMGNLIKPSQDEISKSLRDLHAQMLVTQQIEHMMKTGEAPPKTGFDRDEDSAFTRALRRERERTMRELGIDRKTAEEMLKTALDSYKTRLRNQIEENEKAVADVESGKPYEKRGKRKLDLDEEAQALKARNDELKKRLDELTRDPAKELEAKIARAVDAVAKTIAVRKEQIAAIQAGTFDFDAKRPTLENDRLASLRNELKALNAQKDALKKALFPYGTDAEVLRKLKLREDAVGKSIERWSGMAADYTAATSWEDRAKAVAPSAKKNILDAEFASPEIKAAQQKIHDAQKQRDAARRKVLEYRAQLGNEQDRLYAAKAWARFIGGTSVLARAIYDMSAVGIQGGKFLRSHPVKATKIAAKATKAFFTQKSADALAVEIKSHPYFEDFKDNGGHIYKMDGLEGDVPEDFRVVEQGVRLPGGKVITAESIPGVKRSNRSFAGFLNKAALELYADMVEAADPDGAGATDAQKKLIADFVNVTLGYGYGSKGASGKLGLVPAVLDALAWAPRKAVAELKYATGWNLLSNLNTRKNEISGKEIWNVDKQIGREYLRYTLGSLAFGACLLLLAKLINGDDDDDRNRWSDMLDPRSAEFGRVSIGNTRYSVFGGNEMVWRLFARLYTGQTKANGVVKDYRYHGIEAALNYLRGKLNPIYSAAVDVKMGENFVGEKLSDKSGLELARNYLLPLTANALYENFAKNPDDPLAAIFNAAPTFYGMTSSTYSRDPLDRVAAQGDEAKRRAKAAVEAGETEAAKRIMSALGERGETYAQVKAVQKLENKIKDLRKKGATDAQLADGLRALAEAREKALKSYRLDRKKFKWDDMSWAK